jgi:GNAT superfamily N-acetyltransferase
MPSYSCDFCGRTISADDEEQLIGLVAGHVGEVHADYGITETAVRNYFAATHRLIGPTGRLDGTGPIETFAVTPERLDDILDFFDHDAFAGMPEWASCYCMFRHVDQDEWGQRTWQQNRSDLAERIGSGATTGVVAYAAGKVVGWCNASLRREFPGDADGTDADNTVLVTRCFQVAPPYRGHGVARRLLRAAIDLAKQRGCSAVEAFPNLDPDASNPEAYPGPAALYRSAGFDVVERHAWLEV